MSDITDLKVTVSAETENQVIDWVIEQIDTALQDRAEKEQRWEKWIKQYEELLPQSKTFPWPNCSNISLPVTPIAVETIHAREVNTLLSIRPYVQVKPKKKGADRDNCSALENFYDQVCQHVLKMYKTASDNLLEKNKMGTSWFKVYWNYDKTKKRKTGADGKGEWEFIVNDDAKLEVIPLEDMIYPTNATHEQTCSFLAQRIRRGWTYLKSRGALGIYENVDKVENFYKIDTQNDQTGTDIQKTKEDLEKVTRTSPAVFKEHEFYEVWFEYDTDNDGFAERTVMTIHKDSRVKLRWIHHPYDHGMRPFIPNKYMDRVNRIDGKGICEMSEYLQEATNTVANQTLDNMTIANAKAFKARRSVKDDIPKDGLYPGITVYLDDPATDLMEMSMGDVKQSNFEFISILRDYHERRTKVTDYTLGKESSMMKSRATASGTLALLQESGRYFDLIINNSRNVMVEVAYQVIELYLQYRPDKVFEVVGYSKDQEGKEQEVIKMFKLPEDVGNLRENYEFYCVATSLAVNKEIEKQANLIMIQQLGGMFQQMIQLLMMMENPQIKMPPDIKKFIAGIIKSYFQMAEDLIRSFEKIDVKSYLPDMPDIIKQAYGQQDMGGIMNIIQGLLGGANGQGGAGAGVSGPNQGGGMGGVQPPMQGAGATGNINT